MAVSSFSGYMTVASGDITSTGDSSPKANLGALAMVNGNVYQYVKFDNGTAVAAAAGGLLYWLPSYVDTFVVTSDESDASSIDMVAGIATAVYTDTYYVWILKKGYYSAIKTNADDDIAAGDKLIGSTTDLCCNSVASGTASTYRVFGQAVAADVDASDTVAGIVDCL